MTSYAKDRRYLPSHEWAQLDAEEVVVGISDFAQHELSDVVYVELPETGDSLSKGDSFGTVESVKAASDLYMPMSGEIIGINESLEESPQAVNEDPFGKGWMIRLRPSDPTEFEQLLDAEAYEKHCQEEAEGAH